MIKDPLVKDVVHALEPYGWQTQCGKKTLATVCFPGREADKYVLDFCIGQRLKTANIEGVETVSQLITWLQKHGFEESRRPNGSLWSLEK